MSPNKAAALALLAALAGSAPHAAEAHGRGHRHAWHRHAWHHAHGGGHRHAWSARGHQGRRLAWGGFAHDAAATPRGRPVPGRLEAAAAGPASRSPVFDLVSRSAASHGVPLVLAHAVVRVESNYSCAARNGSATGLMQVLPGTARSVGVSGNLTDCSRGLEAGMRYLALAYRAAHGSVHGAATLFNRGLGARPSASGYSRRALSRSA